MSQTQFSVIRMPFYSVDLGCLLQWLWNGIIVSNILPRKKLKQAKSTVSITTYSHQITHIKLFDFHGCSLVFNTNTAMSYFQELLIEHFRCSDE